MNYNLQKRNGRILAIDYGHVRTGLAISDIFGLTSQPLETIKGDKKASFAAKNIEQKILFLEAEKGFTIDTIIFGMPLYLSGKESERSQEVREVMNEIMLIFPNKNVTFFDERLTSIQAERSMKEAGNLSRKERAKQVDSISALILLQSYLDTLHR